MSAVLDVPASKGGQAALFWLTALSAALGLVYYAREMRRR